MIEAFKIKVLKLKLVAIGGRFRGMRGATYKLAHKFHGFSLSDGPDSIRYDDTEDAFPNVYMEVYFLDFWELTDFKNSVTKLHHQLPEPIARLGIVHKPVIFSDPVEIMYFDVLELNPVSEMDFQNTTPPESIDYDSALQDLGSFTA